MCCEYYLLLAVQIPQYDDKMCISQAIQYLTPKPYYFIRFYLRFRPVQITECDIIDSDNCNYTRTNDDKLNSGLEINIYSLVAVYICIYVPTATIDRASIKFCSNFYYTCLKFV